MPVAKRIVLEGPAADAVERLARSGRMSIAQLIASALRREEIGQREERPTGLADVETAVELIPAPYTLRVVPNPESQEGSSTGPETGPSRRDNP